MNNSILDELYEKINRMAQQTTKNNNLENKMLDQDYSKYLVTYCRTKLRHQIEEEYLIKTEEFFNKINLPIESLVNEVYTILNELYDDYNRSLFLDSRKGEFKFTSAYGAMDFHIRQLEGRDDKIHLKNDTFVPKRGDEVILYMTCKVDDPMFRFCYCFINPKELGSYWKTWFDNSYAAECYANEYGFVLVDFFGNYIPNTCEFVKFRV